MLKREKIDLTFWFVLSFYFCIESYRLGLGSIHAPGPVFLPFWVSIIIFIFAVVLLLQGMRKKLIGKVEPFFRGENLRSVVYGTVLLFMYGLLFNWIGFALCTFLFTGFCLKAIGKKKWLTVIGISLTVTILAYMLFVEWLQIQFPKGSWVTGWRWF
jgi:hypothetical protein